MNETQHTGRNCADCFDRCLTPKLLPCPFCGEHPRLESMTKRSGMGFLVICPKCLCQTRMLIEGNWLDKATGYAVTHTKISAARGAADLWNTRDIQPT